MNTFIMNDFLPEMEGFPDHENADWDNKEIDYFNQKLNQYNDNDTKLRFIQSYLNDSQYTHHNIKLTLLNYTTEYYKRKMFEEKYPEYIGKDYIPYFTPIKPTDKKGIESDIDISGIPELSKKQTKEYNLIKENYLNSLTEELNNIGIIEFYRKYKDEVFPDTFTLRGNIKILNHVVIEWDILAPQEKTQAAQPQTAGGTIDNTEEQQIKSIIHIWKDTDQQLEEELKKHKKIISLDSETGQIEIISKKYNLALLSLLYYWDSKNYIYGLIDDDNLNWNFQDLLPCFYYKENNQKQNYLSERVRKTKSQNKGSEGFPRLAEFIKNNIDSTFQE